MGNTNDIKKVNSLDVELSMIQSMEIMDRVDKREKDEYKKLLKKFLLIFVPYAVLGITAFITKSPIPVCIGAGAIGVGAIIEETKSMIRIDREISETIFEPIPQDDDDIDEDDLEPELSKKFDDTIYTGKDFYKDQYKTFVKKQSEPLTTDLEKYNAALGKQRTRRNNNNITLLKKDRDYLTKEETKDQIYYEMCVFMNCYEIPPVNIRDYEFDIYFDEIYKYFESIGVEKRYYERLDGVIRLAVAKVLLDVKKRGKKEVTIKDFVKALKYLKLYEIKDSDIENLQRSILGQLKETKVVSLVDYLNNNGGRKGN